MTNNEITAKLKEYESYQHLIGVDEQLIDAMCLAVELADGNGDDKFTISVCEKAKEVIKKYILRVTRGTFEQVEEHSQKEQKGYTILQKYYNILRIEAKYDLDAFCLCMERYRQRKERFYEPRRKVLKQVVDEIQKLEYDELDELYIHMPPRVGKSQIATFATAWHCGRNDELSNLYVTYANTLGGAFVDGVIELIRDPTYCFEEIFPNEKIVHTDSESHRMNMGRRKKYATLSGRGMEAGLNGQFDAKGWLLLDDLHEGINEVLNPELLRKKQLFFANNVMSRRKMGCKILGIGTLWSLNDIFCTRHEFIQSGKYDKRFKIIKIPAMDENDESNFDYEFNVGYSTTEFRQIRDQFENMGDIASWNAQYIQEPVEREGAIFKSEEMRYYNGILPSEKPLKVVFACDVALGGGDYLSMPVAYCYEDGSVYIDDVVFDNSEKKYTKPKVVQKILEHGITGGYFEANQGGEGYKDEVNQMLLDQGMKINLKAEYAPTDKRKAQRIFDKAGSIREYYYRDATCRNKEYSMFMTNMFSFNFKTNQKHKHQDAADSMASLAYYLEGTWGNAKVEAAINPFRRRQYGYQG